MSTPSDKQDASQPIKKKRAYRPYSEEALFICLREILNGDISIRKAAAKFDIPKRTLLRKLKVVKSGNMLDVLHPVGKEYVLFPPEEVMLVKQDPGLAKNGVMASVLPSIGKGLEVPTQEVIMSAEPELCGEVRQDIPVALPSIGKELEVPTQEVIVSAEPDTEIWEARQDIRIVLPPIGNRRVLTTEEETMFIKHMKLLTEAHFHVSRDEFQIWVKIYLDQKLIHTSGDNLPSERWMSGLFVKYLKLGPYFEMANQSLDIDSSIINCRVEYLESKLASIPKENIWNYVEAGIKEFTLGNMAQMHGKGKVLPTNEKKVKNTSYSITLCGNAMGEILPPFVICRGRYLTSTTSYPADSCSLTGWMDFSCFEEYLLLHVFPKLAERPGPHYFLGMNDSVYLTPDMEGACRLRGITFLCSSGMSQPLEVLLGAVELGWPDQEEMMKKMKALKECQELHFQNLGLSPFNAYSLEKNYWKFSNALYLDYLNIEEL